MIKLLCRTSFLIGLFCAHGVTNACLSRDERIERLDGQIDRYQKSIDKITKRIATSDYNFEEYQLKRKRLWNYTEEQETLISKRDYLISGFFYSHDKLTSSLDKALRERYYIERKIRQEQNEAIKKAKL